MKIYFAFIILLFYLSSIRNVECDVFEEALGHLRPQAKSSVQEREAQRVIERLLGEKAFYFKLQVDPSLLVDGKDSFSLLKEKETIQVTGSSGVSVCWGVLHYLKYYCNSHVSWDGDRISIPEVLPFVNATITAQDRFRYYQNVCTASYSFVWWDWSRWEREIDWMALNGFNLALAFNGQEQIWKEVYLELGMGIEEINEHFTGPAFLAWGRMGNIRGWAGPLSDNWHRGQLQLQKRILRSMRSLGITPVLPAFAGQVPRAFKSLFPHAQLTEMSQWNNFEDKYTSPYLLSPEDPLFKQVASSFLRKYIATYQTDHVYNCDTFNEMTPSSTDENYLKKIGQSIYSGLSSVDPAAVWMIQGWIFVNEKDFWTKKRAHALLTSVPVGKILVLDLQSELAPQYLRLQSFFGQPFIWCMLHNFGGTSGLHGSSDIINNNVLKARNTEDSSMVGAGITPEGIHQNYVMYDLMNEMAWRSQRTNLTDWFNKYAIRRYGVEDKKLNKAWNLLRRSVYNYKGNISLHGKYILVRRPTLKLKSKTWYNPRDVFKAWEYFVKSSQFMVEPTNTFLYDLVDISRQCLQLIIDEKYAKIMDLSEVDKFLMALNDLEEILSTHEGFLLGRWLESAKLAATNSREVKQFEMNARNQITLWGPNGEIRDYAAKQWAGLVKNYYKPRWEIFFNAIIDDVDGRGRFNRTAVHWAIFKRVEDPFTNATDTYPTHATGNTVAVALRLLKTWWLNSKKYL